MNVDKFGRNSKSFSKMEGIIGPPGIGFKLLPTGDFDLENRYLNNVGKKPEYPHQAVSKGYVDEQIGLKESSMRNHIDSSLKEIISTINKETAILRNLIDTFLKDAMKGGSMSLTSLPRKPIDDEKYIEDKIKKKVEKIMKTLFPERPFET